MLTSYETFELIKTIYNYSQHFKFFYIDFGNYMENEKNIKITYTQKRKKFHWKKNVWLSYRNN